MKSAIGIFDSGYGGLTIFKEIEALLPQYDFVYLGDNARTPYGTRSFETVYAYTLQAVQWLFAKGCPLVIIACNTASAKALRTIQQLYLPTLVDTSIRVLGVIRPTTEVLGKFTNSQHIGILATTGTVKSDSYPIEMAKLWPAVVVHQLACPMWVPLIENNELSSPGAAYFVQKYMQQLLTIAPEIDTVLLACTHYPLLAPLILKYLPEKIKLLSQGKLVAESLFNYLQRHPNMNAKLTKNGRQAFFTTDDVLTFEQQATLFFGKKIAADAITLS